MSNTVVPVPKIRGVVAGEHDAARPRALVTKLGETEAMVLLCLSRSSLGRLIARLRNQRATLAYARQRLDEVGG